MRLQRCRITRIRMMRWERQRKFRPDLPPPESWGHTLPSRRTASHTRNGGTAKGHGQATAVRAICPFSSWPVPSHLPPRSSPVEASSGC